jgi:hypothetical protein
MPCSLAYKPLAFLRYRPGIRTPFLELGYKARTYRPIGNWTYRTPGTWGRTVVMNERPEPDIEHVRRAMRDHDEREEQDERDVDEDAGQDEDEQQEQ